MISALNSGEYYKSKKFYYDGSGNLIYMAFHSVHKASTALVGWRVYKLTYVDNNVTNFEGPLVGVCDDRATLDWE